MVGTLNLLERKIMARLNDNAYIIEQTPVWLKERGTGDLYHLMGDMLVSYDSKVAFMANDGTLYLLPDFDYSATAKRHLRNFMVDYESREYLGLDTYCMAIKCSGASWDGKHFWPY